ncbi:MFS transporter [Clostridium sp. D2Q-11]|uniref:MFS transporter n=1 Tax=Anaeromonas frigoriresistens TaxID=2683708 RepID=A0A942UUP2_9FIRM|nr:MFS transporter [Anaeromonas frigoriresistens]MBS4537124.1 MFS transporter [Anaeromonas frigoriresistens]
MNKINKLEKSWIMYDWANSAYTLAVTSTILPLFFKMILVDAGEKASLSTVYWGYTNALATLVIAILAPILGTLADYKGYKKIIFIIFVSLGVVSTLGLATVTSGIWIVLLFFYLLSSIGFAGANVFYDSFLVDVTIEEKMDKVSTLGFALGYIGSTIPFIVSMTIVILAQFNKIPIDIATACKIAFIITALWWGLFSIPMIKNVKQVHGIEKEEHTVKKSFIRLYNTFKNIKQHKQLFIFLLAYFFYIDGVSTIIKMATSYGADLGIGTTTLLVVLLVTQFVAFPFAILYGKLAEKFTARKMIYVGIVVYIIICIYAYFLDSALDFWILAMLVGTSQGGIQALSRSYFGKLVPKENSNEFFGFYNIFGKFAAIMGPLLVGFITQVTGKTNNGVFSIIILFIIGGLILLKVPKEENIQKKSVLNNISK